MSCMAVAVDVDRIELSYYIWLLVIYYINLNFMAREKICEVVIPEGARILETNTGLASELMDGTTRVRAAVAGVFQEFLALSDRSFVKVHPNGSRDFPQLSPSGKHVYVDAAAADRAHANRFHRAVRAHSHSATREARFAATPEPKAQADAWTPTTHEDLIVGGLE
jgi:hypothetical protein